MKKLATIMFCALGMGMANAGTMGPVCNPDNVTVPCPCNAWEIGISALYLQPTTNSPLLNPTILSLNGGSYHGLKSKSAWDWGFLLQGGYHFNTGNDLNLNWLHFNGNSSKNFVVSFPVSTEIPDITNTAHLKYDTDVDVVNLELAQSSDFGRKTNIRFYGGGQYVNSEIKRTERNYEKTRFTPTDTLFQYSTTHTKFQGAGPRVGIDMTHKLNYGFSLFAQSATALLLGERKAKLSGANLSGLASTSFSAYAKRSRIIPELEAKLGLNYQWMTPNNGTFSLMGGWMWQHYLNMFLMPPGGRTNLSPVVTQNDFAMDGPFIKGKWVSGC
ncbi:Lpg1974 family pore-forming outer membrane protein [Fluoribacter dumoffii]|nr:Lpg1974 family pore-forming outer membrane protein [Fluoribacter dumoffii]MCW8387276.1 Lpg1974 family pore-forming outer membrane protein [Fluoribacter dumoffii]MCW8417218.1 Lpg1974 family pore-forming outer membrane protein [Fluoribacter dumoffii]MCW8454942.1 Lpg1974 family pore-forming outer membrane protein [Fluoribacter dumoffii]MCW8460981.1 Lpg1974 family pore-forming outer membrane protein [Fluoribacter dumoffii]MCW8484423.1 Lpg1974 family pore-forming outer membrane protein [Fluoriba